MIAWGMILELIVYEVKIINIGLVWSRPVEICSRRVLLWRS